MVWPRSSSSASGSRSRPEPFPRRLARAVRRILFIALTLVLVTGGVFFAWQIHRFIFVSSYFRIREFRIHCDGEELKKDALAYLDRSLIKTGNDNLFRLDHQLLAMQLSNKINLPRAKSAVVSKIYPGTLKVDFVERHQMVIALLDDPYLMDGEGVLLARVSPEEMRHPRLPIVTGLHVKSARPHLGDKLNQARLTDILGTVNYIRDNDKLLNKMIVEWNVNARSEVTAILNTRTEVRFGDRSPIELLDKLITGLEMNKELENASYIDLRMDRQVVFNPR